MLCKIIILHGKPAFAFLPHSGRSLGFGYEFQFTVKVAFPMGLCAMFSSQPFEQASYLCCFCTFYEHEKVSQIALASMILKNIDPPHSHDTPMKSQRVSYYKAGKERRVLPYGCLHTKLTLFKQSSQQPKPYSKVIQKEKNEASLGAKEHPDP